MDKWRPTDTMAEGSAWVATDGRERPKPFPESLLSDGGRREHYNARCKVCRRKAPMREAGAQIALTWLSDQGHNDVPLAALQHAYDQVPQELR
jgi:hypothetical protein